jgi:hypothetical protein
MLGTGGGIPLASLSFAISATCFALWAGLLAGRSILRRSARGRLVITGNLRTEPDPWLEYLLRGALAEFDRELRKIVPRLYGPDGDKK